VINAFGAICLCALTVAGSSPHLLKLGDNLLEVPQKYLKGSSAVPPSLQWLPGLDDNSRELLLTIDADEVAESIPGFKSTDGNYRDDVRLRLSALTREEKNRYLDASRFSEAWSRKGSYRDAVVEQDMANHLTKIYRKVEYPNSWESFKTPMTGVSDGGVYSMWVGHCIRSRSPLTSSGTLALCKSYVVVDDMAVNFTVSEQNLSRVDALRAYLSKLVSGWKKQR
jgi:hypothetical protein